MFAHQDHLDYPTTENSSEDSITPLLLEYPRVCYRMRVKAKFQERFELHEFPVDAQDLQIEIISATRGSSIGGGEGGREASWNAAALSQALEVCQAALNLLLVLTWGLPLDVRPTLRLTAVAAATAQRVKEEQASQLGSTVGAAGFHALEGSVTPWLFACGSTSEAVRACSGTAALSAGCGSINAMSDVKPR